MILETVVVGSFQCNCTIIGCEETKEAIVIDPGDEPEKIMEVIKHYDLNVKYLLHTHAHLDHIMGTRYVKEKTNAMHVELPEKMDLITNDTSWTKQMFVLPNILKNLKENGQIISLIKPHYEANKKLLKKGVLEESDAKEVAENVLEEIKSLGLKVNGFVKSPVIGKGGNTEYLAFLQV